MEQEGRARGAVDHITTGNFGALTGFARMTGNMD
jgi:hypothetical protein